MTPRERWRRLAGSSMRMAHWQEIFEARGTLQRLLAQRLGEPVRVMLLDQVERGERFERRVELRTTRTDRVVCLGDSVLEIASEPMRSLVAGGEIGLGQILERLALTPEFELLACDAAATPPWRRYILSGEGWRWEIRETFPLPLTAIDPAARRSR